MSAFKITKKNLEVKTIGETLKKARQKQGLSLEEVEKNSKIRVRYLRCLEEEDWQGLPGPAYIPGFIRSYCRFLKIPEKPLLSAWQSNPQAGVKADVFPLRQRQELRWPKVLVTPRLLLVGLLGIFFLGILSYIVYQLSGFTRLPYLIINSPVDGTVVNQDTLPVEGKISPAAELYINGQISHFDAEGNFKQEVKLKKGENNISIVAQNRSGKRTEKELLIILKEEGS
jgi:cytoskeletal protein RodZ